MAFVDVKKNGTIALVMLDRPDRLNAISSTLAIELHDALFHVNNDPEVRAIILGGNGRAFCAGDDLKEFDLQTADDAATVRHIQAIQRVTYDLLFGSKLVVGAIHGYAVGGGFEWMLNCDLIVASEELTAFFPETQWGQFPTGGVTHLLPQAIGYQHAMELLVLGEKQTARGLMDRGLVNWVVPKEQVMTKATAVAELAASKSPFSVSALKRLLTSGISPDLGRALHLEEVITIESFKTAEARERSKQFPTNKG
ncbi:enoyl-CoA hydratase/isomerase family protein [Mesorhizobium sp. 2RAF21]|uniref:enoyl-CoA hydratase/isomerase family protein n=1 Tax=Mesorhizobium sp. 2RAF21 TaxID=3232995 RepID=UPI003F96EA93